MQERSSILGQLELLAGFCGDPTGAVILLRHASGPRPATHDLRQWNYIHWQTFNPGLFAGVFNPADDTTDGYKYICPAYVATAPQQRCRPGRSTLPPAPAQQAQGQFVTLSVGVAATLQASLIVALNGQTLIWHAGKKSEPASA